MRDLDGAQAELSFDLPEQATLADLFDLVRAAHPALERRVRDERGAMRPHVNVFVGEDNVRNLDDLDTRLSPNAEVSIIAAISGG